MKPKHLNKGDKVAIVSLSSGVLGESFVKHELDIAEKRLKDYGLIPVYMPNSLKGITYLKEHPEARAADLKTAFLAPDIKGIICAIGGDDTYRLAPYLLEDKEFVEAVKNNPKLFTGFSDTTVNHLMLNRLGLNTFYGPNIICDLAELDIDMLKYTKEWFETYLGKKLYEIKSSDTWYYERQSFAPEAVGTPRKAETEINGYEVLQGSGMVTGQLFGGCLDSLYDLLEGNIDAVKVSQKYNLIPTNEELQGKILFIETSDSKMTPQQLRVVLTAFRARGTFNAVGGVLVGKPQDEAYYDEYKDIYKELLGDLNLPIMYNINFGHATPRCVIPYNIRCAVDYDNKTITLQEDMFE